MVHLKRVRNSIRLKWTKRRRLRMCDILFDFVMFIFEPGHEIFNNVVCATSKASDQPAQTRSLIRAFACRLSSL